MNFLLDKIHAKFSFVNCVLVIRKTLNKLQKVEFVKGLSMAFPIGISPNDTFILSTYE